MAEILSLNIQSEIGELEGVILHTPGAEVENMTPGTAQRALYSDILNLSIAKTEYDQLQGVLGKYTRTFQVTDLLEQVLANYSQREMLIKKVCESEGALEYYEQTGNRMSELNARLKEKEAVYDLCFLVLDLDRAVLYERIDRRVDIMLEEGLLEETQKLKSEGVFEVNLTAAQAIGYKELLGYLDGEETLAEATENLKTATPVWLVMLFIGAFIAYDVWLLLNNDLAVEWLIWVVLVVPAFCYVLVASQLFQMVAHYNCTVKQYIKNSLLVAIAHPLCLVVNIGLAILPYFTFFYNFSAFIMLTLVWILGIFSFQGYMSALLSRKFYRRLTTQLTGEDPEAWREEAKEA